MPASGQKQGETVSDFSAFGSMERRGWADATRAAGYVELFASASDQAIDCLLDAVRGCAWDRSRCVGTGLP